MFFGSFARRRRFIRSVAVALSLQSARAFLCDQRVQKIPPVLLQRRPRFLFSERCLFHKPFNHFRMFHWNPSLLSMGRV